MTKSQLSGGRTCTSYPRTRACVLAKSAFDNDHGPVLEPLVRVRSLENLDATHALPLRRRGGLGAVAHAIDTALDERGHRGALVRALCVVCVVAARGESLRIELANRCRAGEGQSGSAR